MKLLFVCLGNICRSAAAEGVMQHKLRERRLAIDVDSAGTYGGHSGQRADPRMRSAARERGYDLMSISRKIRTEDFWEADHIFVMDDSNYHDVLSLSPDLESGHKIHRMAEYCTNHVVDHIPDPYYGGRDGFEHVLNLLEDACDGILMEIIGVK